MNKAQENELKILLSLGGTLELQPSTCWQCLSLFVFLQNLTVFRHDFRSK
jgi:hypothetical protein